MAQSDLALNALLDSGIRNCELDHVLASNAVLDWFGRAFIGREKIIEFYQNSNSNYDHSMNNVKETEAFEERPAHHRTHKIPLENFISPDITGDNEQWFDCETHSPVNLKTEKMFRTPPHKSTPTNCPGAPCPKRYSFLPLSDDELNSDSNESGITPLDTSIDIVNDVSDKSPGRKRFKTSRFNDESSNEMEEPRNPVENRYSDLFYLESSGTVIINRPANDEPEHRECKLMLSYRINKDNPLQVQIALIVYKSNSRNPKTRRNLLTQFDEKIAEVISTTPINKPSTSRCRTVVKERQKPEEMTAQVSTAPAGKQKKPTKRPLVSKASLRF